MHGFHRICAIKQSRDLDSYHQLFAPILLVVCLYGIHRQLASPKSTDNHSDIVPLLFRRFDQRRSVSLALITIRRFR